MVGVCRWQQTLEETGLPADWIGLMPAGKMHIRGGVGTHISVTTFVSMDPYVKRGHVAPSPERKKVLCSEVLSGLGSMIGFEKSSPAPTTTKLKKAVRPVVTAASRWIISDFATGSGWRTRLVDALERLGFHEREFVWKAIFHASIFRNSKTSDMMISLQVLRDRIDDEIVEELENRGMPAIGREVTETTKLISKIIFDRAVFGIVTSARGWIAEEFKEDSRCRSQLVLSLKVLSEEKRNLLWGCMNSASLDRGQRQASNPLVRQKIFGEIIEGKAEAGDEVREAIQMISEIVAAQFDKGGSPRPHAMRFAVFAAGVWTEWTGRTCLWLDESHRHWPFKEWLNEQLDSVSGGRLGEDMVEWVARAPKASKEQTWNMVG